MHKDTRPPEWSPVAKRSVRAAAHFAELFRRLYPSLAARCDGRVERAVTICTTAGACKPTECFPVFQVSSQSGRGFYEVDMKDRTCTCPDHRTQAAKPPGERTICKHRLAIGFHIMGPEWAHEANKARERVVRKAQRAMDEAWKRSNEAATVYETRAMATGWPQDEIDEAEAEMIRLVKAAEQLSSDFAELINKPSIEFIFSLEKS